MFCCHERSISTTTLTGACCEAVEASPAEAWEEAVVWLAAVTIGDAVYEIGRSSRVPTQRRSAISGVAAEEADAICGEEDVPRTGIAPFVPHTGELTPAAPGE